MKCKNCGATLDEGALFCRKCGTAAPREPEPMPQKRVRQRSDGKSRIAEWFAKCFAWGKDRFERIRQARIWKNKRFLTVSGAALALLVVLIVVIVSAASCGGKTRIVFETSDDVIAAAIEALEQGDGERLWKMTETSEQLLGAHPEVFGEGDSPEAVMQRYYVQLADDFYTRMAERYGTEPGAIPPAEYAHLEPEDVPERESRLIGDTEKKLPAQVEASQLLVSAEEAAPITQENTSAAKAQLGHSVMLLEVTRDGSVAGYGTGFVITREGHILTCEHVVNGAESVRARMYWPGLPGGPVFWFDCDVLYPARKDVDMALLRIRDGSGFVPLNLRDAEHPVGDAENMMVLGYPFAAELNPDLTKLVHNHFIGHVSSIQNAGEDSERCYQSGEGKAGNSGSPVISMLDGRVVGVFDGSKLQKGKSLTEEMNYFTSIRLFWKYFVTGGEPGGQA